MIFGVVLCGDYFSRGETAPKPNYSEEYSKWIDIALETLQNDGVIDSRYIQTADYDAATANWGDVCPLSPKSRNL